MSRSPPPPPHQWPGYHPQGSAVGPPPMPNKQSRSPDRERRPSPGYDREAEFRRFQEWEKRNRKSPPPPPRSPPRSPRRERSPPPNWVRRSPPRSQPQPPDWPRRSPPNWRRSPPRYVQPRGRSPVRARSPPRARTPPRSRSPPRGRSPPRWRPPPPEWDRYRYSRRSPPRYGPPPAHWDNRRPPPPHENRWPQHPLPSKPVVSKPNGTSSVAPPISESRPSPEQMDDSPVEENYENYELPDYDAEVPLGQKYVIAVSGFFCKICHKFYNSESSAKVTHCKSKTHYEKFVKWVGDKKEEALAEKRNAVPDAPEPVPAPTSLAVQEKEEPVEPPAKVPKLEPQPPEQEIAEDFGPELVIKEEVKDSDNETSENQYDPSEPTAEEDSKPTAEAEVIVMSPPKEAGNVSCESSSEAEKSSSGTPSDFVEATLYNFRKMKVSELKENLKKRNLPLHGLKPLLLKRLEKALLAEAAEAAVADAEEITKEEPQDETKEEPDVPAEVKEESQAEDTAKESVSEGDAEAVTEIRLVMHESDIEVSNQKTQWITDRELERELSQVTGVMKVKSVVRAESKMGKKTIVEWKIMIDFTGKFPEEGVNFHMESHQQLPFRAELSEE